MGIFDALNTAVSGLQAQSFALQNISGNIANSQTTGYKETNAFFEDLVSAAALGEQTANGVTAGSKSTNTVQGTIQSSSVSTDMAINGDGWFVVAKPTGTSDNQPVFSGVNDYTRAGDFQLNSGGYLVNGAGYYLMGIPINRTTGNPIGSSPQVLQFTNDFVPAQETTAITYQLNLPSTPKSGMLNGSDFEANPLAGASPAATIVGNGAKLATDAVASGTATVSTSTAATLASLGINSGDQITINDGVHPVFTYTSTGTDTVANLVSAINAAHAGNTLDVSAALSGGATGKLVLTGTNGTASITVGGTATADTAIGFGAGANSFQPVNLLTQGAVAPGDTLTINVNGTPTTITFGAGAGQVATLAQLQSAIGAISGVTGTVNTANGNISLTSNNSIVINSNPPALLAEFGVNKTAAYPSNDTVIANDVSTFTAESIDGGSITAYDSLGNPVNVQFRWAQTGAGAWQLFYQSNSNATGTQAAWQNVGTVFNFNATGQLSPPLTSVTLQNLTVNGDNLGNVGLNFGTGGLTQYANTSGTAQVSQLQQNGFAAGQLQSVAVDGQNRITGTFSNGQTIPLAEITLATFNGQNALEALNGGAYAATTSSGPPIYGATGTVHGSSLEASNVDIATQFSHLIVAQQAYSANAKVMTTSDQMIQSLLQVIQ
jgi:flagellar hook protein FlgE